MRFVRLTPMLQTGDMRRTIDWYGSVLGFQCVKETEGWCLLQRDGVELMFMKNDHIGPPHATATQYFFVEDVKTLWESVKDRVASEWGLELMPYGMLEFAISDPDGYILSFGQPVAATDAGIAG